ncbi:MAG: ABC transporter substrate-binding protein [Anaerolineales bacterium]
MLRKILYTLLLLALLLPGCAPVAAPTVPAPTLESLTAATEPPVAETAAPAPLFEPVSFTDSLGNEILVTVPVQRIVSLAPSVTETLFAIGAGGQVVGRTDYCDYPAEVKNLPSIGGFSAESISIETIISLEPDLVIGGSVLQAEVVKALQDEGIQAFVSQPASLAEIQDAALLFGSLTGHTDEAAAVVDEMQARIDAVTSAVSSLPADQRPTVFYEVWHEPLMSANGKTFIGELIDLAGGVNIFADLPDEYPTVSVEQVVEADPQFIIGPSSHGDQMTAEVIGAREGWENLSAVKNKAIYIVDGDIVSRAGPRIVIALEEFAKILHPDLFQ